MQVAESAFSPSPYRTTTDTKTAAAATTDANSAASLADFGQFLKLFVSQLKNQDPLSPLKGDEFLAQTAQFSSVEQLVSLNRKVSDGTTATGISTRTNAASLIGRTAVARVTGDSGSETEVKGRVVRVEYGKEGELSLGLEDGTTVRFADLVSVSEL